MSTVLVSPGALVSVIDQTPVVSSGPGTVPLIIIATASNKLTPDGSAVAAGTIPANAGMLQLVTSQRDLLQTFGTPNFESLNGTIIQGSEVSEYGLLAAYSYLGTANRAYVLRADVDLSQLAYTQTAPRGPAANGAYWFDTVNTSFGVFRANGNTTPGLAWTAVTVLFPTQSQLSGGNVPLTSFGVSGNIAVVTETTDNFIYENISGSWYLIGSTGWKAARPTVATGTVTNPTVSNGDHLTINGSTVTFTGTTLAQTIIDINTAAVPGVTASNTSNKLTLTLSTGIDFTLSSSGTALTALGLAASYKGYHLDYASHVNIPVGTHSGDIWIKTTNPNFGANYVVKRYSTSTGQFSIVAAPFYASDSLATAAYGASITTNSLYVLYNETGSSPSPIAGQVIKIWNGTAWEILTYTASATAPDSDPTAGTFWINDEFIVDIMINTGNTWEGYLNEYPETDPNGVQITSAMPSTQSTGDPLAVNDLWLDSSDLINYPSLYVYDGSQFNLIDKTDSTTPFGIVFADARPNADGTATGSTATTDMLVSDYVDEDTPNPETYPAGILLFNTRYSTYNVKEWNPTYFTGQGSYTVGAASFSAPTYVARWTTASGNQFDGSPFMGRFAQHNVVVEAIAAQIVSNQDIRSEFVYYNLLAAPAYPEVMSDLINLNIDIKEVAFIIPDVPLRLAPDGTSVTNWATNTLNRPETDEFGRTNLYTYAAEYYPHALTTDLNGDNVVAPASHIALSTFAYNDNVAYPWFSPAGTQRGVVTNASSVGYINAAGDYQPVMLNQGQRDVLFTNDINPIAFLPNRGLTVYGDVTLEAIQTAQSRVNVARLVCFLRYQLNNLVQPFLFQLNNDTTRAAAQSIVQRYLGDLLALEAVTDFAVVCDTTNNSPESIDSNILNISVAIIPQKSIDFIYLPITLVATGTSLS